jgi:copper chaperone CopZ
MKHVSSRNMALFSALAAGACCLPAFALLILGVGSATLGATLARHHWWFLAAGTGLLTTAWWKFIYERQACASAGCRMRGRALTIASLIIATCIVAAFAFNSFGWFNARARHPQSVASAGDGDEIVIPVVGMTCFSCELHVEKVLREIPGVVSVEASAADRRVHVTYNARQVSIDDMVRAVNAKTGYRASSPAATQQEN